MVLLATLAVLSVLIVMATSASFSARTESRLATGDLRRVRAGWLAEAGLQRAILALRDRPESYLSLDPEADFQSPGARPVVLHIDSLDEPDLTDRGEGFTVDVLDEAARLDLNTVPEQVLRRLLPLEPELVDSILDWRDADDLPRAGGAESDYYLSLTPPHLARNGPFETAEELLLVQGVTPGRYFGLDGLSPLAAEEERQAIDPNLAPLMSLLGIDTFEDNVDQMGQARVDLLNSSQEQLQTALADLIDPTNLQELWRWTQETQTEAARANTPPPGMEAMDPDAELELPDELALDGMDPTAELADPNDPAADPPLPGGAPRSLGELIEVVGREQLRLIYDHLTLSSQPRIAGLVNVNTAPPEVLAALPGLDENTAQALIVARERQPFETVGDLLGLTELSDEQFARAAPWFTTRGQTMHLIISGRVGEGREAVTRRLHAVISISTQPAGGDPAAMDPATGGMGADPLAAGAASATPATMIDPATGEEVAMPQRTVRLLYQRLD